MKYDDNFEKIINYIFNSEGGYVNNKNDRGGPTNYGVTQTTYNGWRKQKGLPTQDVKKITKNEAKQLYYEEFWKGTGASEVKDLREAYLIFDTAIICGPYNAKQMYKKTGGNIYQYLKERAKFHNIDISKNSEQNEFKQGWFNRLTDLEKNMNEIVNSGYYVPPYQKDITPFDKGYNGPLKEVDSQKYSEVQIKNLRNKYLYLLNKSKDPNILKNGVPTGLATPVSTTYNSTVSNPVPNKSPEPKKSPSQKFSDTIRQKLKNKINANNKKINFNFNKSTTPKNSANGHWVTMNGAHVFIED